MYNLQCQMANASIVYEYKYYIFKDIIKYEIATVQGGKYV